MATFFRLGGNSLNEVGQQIAVITLNEVSSLPVSLNYSLSAGSASLSDFSASSGTLSFAPGETSKSISINVINDSDVESIESLLVNLSSPVNAILPMSRWVLFIGSNDNASATPPTLNAMDSWTDEAAGMVYFRVSLSAASNSTVTANYKTLDGSATAGADFVDTTGVLSFAPGETEKIVGVPLINDTENEGLQSFLLELNSVVGATRGVGVGLGYIEASDAAPVALPQIFMRPRVVNETDAAAFLDVFLSAPSLSNVGFTWNVSTTGSSISSNDFVLPPSTNAIFPPGVTYLSFAIPLRQDAVLESPESYLIRLSAASGGTFANTNVPITLAGQNTLSGIPNLSVSNPRVDESRSFVVFDAELDRASQSLIQVNYNTQDITAHAGSDYVATSGTLSFLPGRRVGEIVVPLLTQSVSELTESFRLVLASLNPDVTLAYTNPFATIIDNDAVASGTSYLQFEHTYASDAAGYIDIKISRTAPFDLRASFQYGDNPSGPAFGEYLSPFSGSFEFAPGQVEGTLRLPTNPGAASEQGKSLYFSLSGAVGVTLMNNLPLVTIAPHGGYGMSGGRQSLRVADVFVFEDEGEAIFTFTLDGPALTQPLDIPYALYDGKAAEDTDYFENPFEYLRFVPGGPTTLTVQVPIIDDDVAELPENFYLELTLPSGVDGPGAAFATIIDDDGDGPGGQVYLSLGNSLVHQNDGYAATRFQLDRPSLLPTTIAWRDFPIGMSGNDYYSGQSGTVVIPPGQTWAEQRWPVDFRLGPATWSSFQVEATSVSSNASVANRFGLVSIAPSGGPAAMPMVSTSYAVIDEDGLQASYTLRLSQPSDKVVTVSYQTALSAPEVDVSFEAQGRGSVSFMPYQTVATVRVYAIPDEVREQGENFDLTLTSAVNATIVNATGQGYVLPSDQPRLGGLPMMSQALSVQPAALAPDRVVVSVESRVVNESEGFVDVLFRLNGPSDAAVSVAYSSEADNTSSTSDFGAGNAATLIFRPGQTLQVVRFALTNDSTSEGAESFHIKLSNAVGAAIGNSYASVTMPASDRPAASGLPLLYISAPVVDEGAGLARFTLSLDRASSGAVSFEYRSGGNSATAGNDFVSTSGSAGFLPGETVLTVWVPVLDDSSSEGDETFTLFIDKVSGAVAAMPRAFALIAASDQAPAGTPSLSIAASEAYENDGFIDVVVRLSVPSVSVVTVNYSDTSGSASSQDYASGNSGVLSFGPGETVKTLRFGLVDDSVAEALVESFTVTLASPVGATLNTATATLSIIDTDAAVTATITDDTTGTARGPVVFTVTFSQAVTGLTFDDFWAEGGIVNSLTGSGASYTVMVTPLANFQGRMTLALPRGKAVAAGDVLNNGVGAEQMVDVQAPSISSYTPANNATGAARQSNIVLRLSETVTLGTGTFVLHIDGGDVVQRFEVNAANATLTLTEGGTLLTLNPTQDLLYNTRYSLSSAAGTLLDAVGNALPAISGYSFTTVANAAPVAANGNATTLEDQVLSATLPAATDAESQLIAYAAGNLGPAKGQLVINANGSYTYTPNTNANGSDSFGYLVSDSEGASNSYTMTVAITPVNDAPTGGVSVSGTTQIFATLTATSTLADVDGLSALAYQWLRGGNAIAGATAASYKPVLADIGAALSVRVSYSDGGGTAESVVSAATAAVLGYNSVPGSAANDRLVGTSQPDSITGLAGDDVLNGGSNSDVLDGGTGRDVADYRGASAVNANLQTGVAAQSTDSDTLIAIEAIFGSSAADTLRGLDGGANLPGETLRGGSGNDSLDGGTGLDMAEFTGLLSAYTLTRTQGTLNVSVAHNGGGADGTDALSNVELLLFADRVVAFGPRVEEVARVAFALWSPAIYASHTLFSKGLSFYTNEFGYSVDTLCQVALQYHPEVGLALANKLVGNAPGTTLTAAGLLTLMNANGGGDSATGRAAAVKAVALDAATSAQMELAGVFSKGVVATLNFDSDVYFAPLPG